MGEPPSYGTLHVNEIDSGLAERRLKFWGASGVRAAITSKLVDIVDSPMAFRAEIANLYKFPVVSPNDLAYWVTV